MEIARIESWLERMNKGKSLIIRDDQYELPELQEIFRLAGKKKLKIHLIDSGKLNPQEIETLSGLPFSFYTSDSARPDPLELSLVSKLLLKKRGPVYYFLQGEFDQNSPVFAIAGVFTTVFVSNRERPRDVELLTQLSEQISRAGSNFVYYHRGNLEEKLAELSQKRWWLHVSNKFFDEENEMMVLDLVKNIKKNKGQLIVHVDRSQSYYFLKLLSDNGAFLIFNTPPAEGASKVQALEARWLKKKLPEQAFYLYKEIMA
jgi:hypothetical protein